MESLKNGYEYRASQLQVAAECPWYTGLVPMHASFQDRTV